MKEFLVIAGAALAAVTMMIRQLHSLKKHHPNAELLIGLLEKLGKD